MMRLSKEQASSNPSLIVRVFWGDILYDTVLCEPKDRITVGRKPGSTFVLDLDRGSTLIQLPLVEYGTDGTARLGFDSKMKGHVRSNGELIPLENLRKRPETEQLTQGLFGFPLGNRDTASVVVGDVSFDISWSKNRSIIPRPIVLDSRAAVITGAIAVSMVLMLALFSMPTQETPEPEEVPERIVQIIAPKSRMEAIPAASAHPSPSPVTEPQAATPEPVVATPTPKAPTAAESLKNANLGNLVTDLSALGTNVAAPTAKSAQSSSEPTTQNFSAQAVKASGGKKASLGKTQGAGEGGLTGTGPLSLAGNSAYLGTTKPLSDGPVTDSGAGLDRQVIDQIVRRRQDRIRLCYERQLNFSPGLAGKVLVQFHIGGTGAVLKANILEDTMKNNAVNKCIAAEVKTWTFPRPKGGAMVKVEYPFVFESGGAARGR